MTERHTKVTDSPWFWISLFLCGGLLILTLAAPQIQRRQQRLDLQFRARQEAGQTVRHDTVPHDFDPEQAQRDTLVPLQPLVGILALLLAVLTLGYWLVQIRRLARADVHNPTERHGEAHQSETDEVRGDD